MSFGLAHGVPPVSLIHLVFGVQPSGGEFTLVITPSPTVEVQDRANMVVTEYTGPITVRLGKNVLTPPPNDGTLSGTLTVDAVAGVATFADLAVDAHFDGGPTGSFTLIAHAAGLQDVESAVFTQGWPA